MRTRFTRHAHEKMQLLARYGFSVSEDMVIETVWSPALVDRRGVQLLALRPISEKYALRVVYEVPGRRNSGHNPLPCKEGPVWSLEAS